MNKTSGSAEGVIFGTEMELRRRDFERLRNAGLVAGSFSSAQWKFRGAAINFREIDTAGRGKGALLLGFAGDLARCFAVHTMQQDMSAECVRSRVEGLKWLHGRVGEEMSAWVEVTRATLDRVVRDLVQKSAKATAYQRAGSISKLAEYLNGIAHTHGGVITPLLRRPIRWRPGLPNPIRAQLDITSEEARDHSSKKYIPSIHLALGRARSQIKANPELEPFAGYDLIRLESLTFAAALGLRVGEITSLEKSCVDHDEATSSMFVRVWTEKGQLPAARPISNMWSPLIAESYDYLLNVCAPARARAAEIESSGFHFVADAIRRRRQQRPLAGTRADQMASIGLCPDRHWLIEEIAACFNVSAKEFSSDGRFGAHSIPLPKLVGARISLWMDKRFKRWDWNRYSVNRTDSRTGQPPGATISAARVGLLARVSKSTLPKADWFYPELRLMLQELSQAGVFGEEETDPQQVLYFRTRWRALKLKILANRGGNCAAVDSLPFVEDLSRRYRRSLERHYREVILEDDGENEDESSQALDDSASELAKEIISLPRLTPLSEHLIVVWEGQFSGRQKQGLLPRPIFRSDYYNYLRANSAKKTIFQRLSIKDEQGKIYSISVHQIRHWVTTALLRSGPSEMMVDLWMGREPGQSRSYDHRTASERAEFARARYSAEVVPDDFVGRRVNAWRKAGMQEREISELVSSKMRVMHFVPWGGCTRELYVSPCQRGLMCLRGFGTASACESFHIDPASEEARRSIVALRQQYALMLAAVEPHVETTRKLLLAELNDDQPLDQHIRFMLDVVRGCDQALAAYRVGEQLSDGTDRLISVAEQKLAEVLEE